jgi:hypothetical protein
VHAQSGFGRHNIQRIQQFGTSTLCSDVERVMELAGSCLRLSRSCSTDRAQGSDVANAPHIKWLPHLRRPTCKKLETVVSCDNALRRCTSKLSLRVFIRLVAVGEFLSSSGDDSHLPCSSPLQKSISKLYRDFRSPQTQQHINTSATPPLTAIVKRYFVRQQSSRKRHPDLGPKRVRPGISAASLALPQHVDIQCRASNADAGMPNSRSATPYLVFPEAVNIHRAIVRH